MRGAIYPRGQNMNAAGADEQKRITNASIEKVKVQRWLAHELLGEYRVVKYESATPDLSNELSL